MSSRFFIAVFALVLAPVSQSLAATATEPVPTDELRLGLVSVLEGSAAINRDRPSYSTALFLAPRLSLTERFSVGLGFGAVRNWLERDENPYDFTDLYLEGACSELVREPVSGISVSGRLRAYAPTSKASRNSGSVGQVRLIGDLSRSFGPLSLELELNAQKHFHRATTWDTAEEVGSEDWLRQAGREDYIENNASYGFGETAMASLSIPGWPSLGLRWSMLQSRAYSGESHADDWGSSLLQQPRETGWAHAFRFSAELSYELLDSSTRSFDDLTSTGGSRRTLGLSGASVSLAYDILAPQLQNGGRTRSLNPFNPQYGQALLSLTARF